MLLSLCLGCSKGGPTDSGVFVFDAGFASEDSGAVDSGLLDAEEARDLGLVDSGSEDALLDAGDLPDAEAVDEGIADLGPADLGAPDLGQWPDADPVDLGPADDGVFPDAEPFDIGPPDVGVDAGMVTLPDASFAQDSGPPAPDAGPVSCQGYGFNFCTACLGVGCCADLWNCDADPFGCRPEYLGCFGNCQLNGYSGLFCTGCFQSAAGIALSQCMLQRCAADCQ